MELGIVLFLYFVTLTLLLHGLILLAPSFAEKFRFVPLLDFWMAAFIWAPPLSLAIAYGWKGMGICLAVQALYMNLYSLFHSTYFRMKKKQRGGRLLFSLSKGLNRLRVLMGFYVTLLAVPVFVVLRIGQLTVYPLLQLTVDFPAYSHRDWVQLSRQKFHGLVGLDLLWCLYCEWAAGVYSLGGEMVRNNESFWCPIKFYDGKHCENCQIDFPDIKDWVSPQGEISEVQELLEKKYPKEQSPKAWYQHSSRDSSSK